MPLFEVETESHIIITWAKDNDDAAAVVSDAYPKRYGHPHDQTPT